MIYNISISSAYIVLSNDTSVVIVVSGITDLLWSRHSSCWIGTSLLSDLEQLLDSELSIKTSSTPMFDPRFLYYNLICWVLTLKSSWYVIWWLKFCWVKCFSSVCWLCCVCWWWRTSRYLSCRELVKLVRKVLTFCGNLHTLSVYCGPRSYCAWITWRSYNNTRGVQSGIYGIAYLFGSNI